ncbi:hypothetical protein CF326_g7671 [Tilletia indica]|nr:hypothetical protein CF326_g7671 [Tilletia indica]
MRGQATARVTTCVYKRTHAHARIPASTPCILFLKHSTTASRSSDTPAHQRATQIFWRLCRSSAWRIPSSWIHSPRIQDRLATAVKGLEGKLPQFSACLSAAMIVRTRSRCPHSHLQPRDHSCLPQQLLFPPEDQTLERSMRRLPPSSRQCADSGTNWAASKGQAQAQYFLRTASPRPPCCPCIDTSPVTFITGVLHAPPYTDRSGNHRREKKGPGEGQQEQRPSIGQCPRHPRSRSRSPETLAAVLQIDFGPYNFRMLVIMQPGEEAALALELKILKVKRPRPRIFSHRMEAFTRQELDLSDGLLSVTTQPWFFMRRDHAEVSRRLHRAHAPSRRTRRVRRKAVPDDAQKSVLSSEHDHSRSSIQVSAVGSERASWCSLSRTQTLRRTETLFSNSLPVAYLPAIVHKVVLDLFN